MGQILLTLDYSSPGIGGNFFSIKALQLFTQKGITPTSVSSLKKTQKKAKNNTPPQTKTKNPQNKQTNKKRQNNPTKTIKERKIWLRISIQKSESVKQPFNSKWQLTAFIELNNSFLSTRGSENTGLKQIGENQY